MKTSGFGRRRTTVTRRRFLALVSSSASGFLALSACGPAASPPAPAAKPAAPVETAGPALKGPEIKKTVKTLVIAGNRRTTSVSQVGTRDTELACLVGTGLCTQDPARIEPLPWMAEELPKPGSSAWVRVPGKSAVVTFRLRPNIVYHDGTPFSAKDFVFGLEVSLNEKVPYSDRAIAKLLDKIEAPDDRTVVLHWKADSSRANVLHREDLPPLPRHKVESLYRSDVEAFGKSQFWTREWIGTGPYKVADFKEGEQAVFEAFDRYFLGRPKIDRIVWRFITDANAILAGVLADEIDFVIRSGITHEGGVVLKRDYEAKGRGTVYYTPTNWIWVAPSPTNPIFGWKAPNQDKVRQALLHAINREEMAKTLTDGTETVAHAPMSARRPLYEKALASVTTYEFNLDRAKALMASAGWRPGPDGILVNDKGERFVIESRTEAGNREREQIQAAVNEYWRRLGVEVKLANLPRRLMDAEENRNRFPGVFVWSSNLVTEEWAERFHSRALPTAENRYTGENVGGWTSADKLLDEIENTFEPVKADALKIEFLQLFSKELPVLPLLYQSERLVLKKGITGLTPRVETGGSNMNTWNIHLWDKA